MLGLGNAATPFGLKAMVELNRLNPRPGVATDAMVLFLVINSTAITLMPPTGTIAVRAAAGSASPGAIWVPTLIATTCSMIVGVLVVYLLRGRSRYAGAPARRRRSRSLRPRPRPDAAGPDAAAARAAAEPGAQRARGRDRPRAARRDRRGQIAVPGAGAAPRSTSLKEIADQSG